MHWNKENAEIADINDRKGKMDFAVNRKQGGYYNGNAGNGSK